MIRSGSSLESAFAPDESLTCLGGAAELAVGGGQVRPGSPPGSPTHCSRSLPDRSSLLFTMARLVFHGIEFSIQMAPRSSATADQAYFCVSRSPVRLTK